MDINKIIEKSVMSFLRRTFEFVIVTSLLLVVLVYSPLFLDCEPESFTINLPKSFTGPLAPNERLNNAEKLYYGDLKWPESLAVYEGNIYSGIHDGYIVRISKDGLIPIIRTGKKSCEGQWEESECGRPLGMRFDKNGKLYVADANFGLLAINVKEKKKAYLLPTTTVVENYNLTFLNDIYLDEEANTIYMTQSTTNWNLTKVVYALMNHEASGRLLSYNLKTKQIKVLAKNLYMPNGVEMSRDKQKLIIAECSSHRILQYNLKGPKEGQIETLHKGLPGEPDNVRKALAGGYWIALNSARTQSTATLSDKLGAYPLGRKIIMKFINGLGALLSYVAQYVPYPAFKTIAFDVQTGRFLVDILPSYGMIVRINEDGEIVESLHSPDGQIAHLSEVLEYDGHLYLGSWRNKFLGKLKV